MDIFLTNTYTKKKELFTPLTPGVVSMYNCGPTVYHFAHIGNMRSFVFADLLKRTFTYNGYKVKQIINITDVGHLTSDGDDGEDKIEKGAKREGKSATEITKFYTDAFFTDLTRLNIDTTSITFPRATAYIKEQIDLITALEKEGHTYITSDGVYFDTNTFPEYGKLGNIDLSGLQEGARVTKNEEKRNPTDFALWKFSAPRETRLQEWPSPWGTGFPGWHVECSAMSHALLGDTFDIHTGGIDHIPVHHNAEIAQSVCAYHTQFVRYWLHNAFMNIGNEKMAKSGDNFITISTLIEKGYNPLDLRYLLLTAHYSSPIDFSFEALSGAHTARTRLSQYAHQETDDEASDISQYTSNFISFINDDLNTAGALAYVWETLKDGSLSVASKKAFLRVCDTVLGLNLFEKEHTEIPQEIQDLLNARLKAREMKDFPTSDMLRKQIEDLGFEIEDGKEGITIKKRIQ